MVMMMMTMMMMMMMKIMKMKYSFIINYSTYTALKMTIIPNSHHFGKSVQQCRYAGKPIPSEIKSKK